MQLSLSVLLVVVAITQVACRTTSEPDAKPAKLLLPSTRAPSAPKVSSASKVVPASPQTPLSLTTSPKSPKASPKRPSLAEPTSLDKVTSLPSVGPHLEAGDDLDKSSSRQFSFSVDHFLNERLKDNASVAGASKDADEEDKVERDKSGESTKGRNLQFLIPAAQSRNNYHQGSPAGRYQFGQQYPAARPNQLVAYKSVQHRPNQVSYQPAQGASSYTYSSGNNNNNNNNYNNNYQQHQVSPPVAYYQVPYIVDAYSNADNRHQWPRLNYNNLVKGYYLEDDEEVEMEPEDSEYETLAADLASSELSLSHDSWSSSKTTTTTTGKPNLVHKIGTLLDKKGALLNKEAKHHGGNRNSNPVDQLIQQQRQEEPGKQEPTMKDIEEQSERIEKAFSEQRSPQLDSSKGGGGGAQEEPEPTVSSDDESMLIDIKKRSKRKPDNSAGNRLMSSSARASSFRAMPTARATPTPNPDELARDPPRQVGEQLIQYES